MSAKLDHICARQAICFQCFKAGAERTRARREAWAQRSLPFETRELTPREVAHRRQMLQHLLRVKVQGSGFSVQR